MKNAVWSLALTVFLFVLLSSGHSQASGLKESPIGDSVAEFQEQEASSKSSSLKELQRNSVYAGVLSINYSRLIPGDKVGITLAGGLSLVTALDGGGVGFMVESTLLTGGGIKHFFEPGILLYFEQDNFWPMVRLGYRYQGPEGFLFRIGPLLGYMDGFSVLPAISLGYSF